MCFQNAFSFTNTISLTPGFSPVLTRRGQASRFNGLFAFAGKPLKRLLG
jgi:hypothetical protein